MIWCGLEGGLWLSSWVQYVGETLLMWRVGGSEICRYMEEVVYLLIILRRRDERTWKQLLRLGENSLGM